LLDRKNILISVAALLVLLWACGPSQTYGEGVMAEHYRMMSNADLLRYKARLSDEIARVEKGGPAPEGVDRAAYLEDLRGRREDVEAQFRGNIRRQRYEQYRKKMDLMYGY
jgi:hypothetical protein